MELAIRMRKSGKKANKRYNFRVVVCRKTASRDGRFLEEIGIYDPAKNPAIFEINKERYDYWLQKGALPSDTLKNLLKRRNKE